MHVKITKSVIDKIPFPEKTIFYRDTELTGFAIRANPTKLVYIVESKVNGRVIRKNIAPVTKLTPEEARKGAKKLLGEMAGGKDIVLEAKRECCKNITLQQAYSDYIKTKNISEGTRIKYERSMRLCFSDWSNRKITSINRDMIEKRFKERSSHSKSIANSDFRFLRALLNFAMEQYTFDSEPLIPSNPCNRLKALNLWNRVERKTSYIHPSKIKAVFHMLQLQNEDSEYIKTVKNQCLFILFTGCRDQEAGCLQWKDIDFELRMVTFSNTKNHKTHILPLGEYLFNFLSNIKVCSVGEYVFPANNADGAATAAAVSSPAFRMKSLRVVFSMSDFATKVRLMEGSSATITGNHISYSEDNAPIFLEKLTGKKEFSFYVNETLNEQPYSIKIGEYTGTIAQQKPFPRNNYWQINLYINTSDLVIEAYIAPIGVYPFIAATRGDILDEDGNNLEVTLPEGCRFHVRTQDGDPCELAFQGGTTSSDIIVLENETGWAHLTAVEGQSVTIRVNNKYDLKITTDGLENYESSMMRAPIGWDIYSWNIPIHLSRPECNEGHK